MTFEPGYIGLFVSGFIASTIIPLPSEGVLLLMLSLEYDPIWCLIIVSIANWLGGLTSYGLGYLGKTVWLEKYFGVKHDKLLKIESKIDQWKVLFALFTWLPIVGDVFAVGLGYFKIHFIKSAFFMFLGKFARYAIIIHLFYQI